VHQSCIKSSTISKRTEPSFHLCLVTKESHRVHPKSFLCLCYVRCKPCTCLALILTLSQNGLKQESPRPMSLTSPSSASKTICEPMVHSVQTVHQSCIKTSPISKRTEPSFHLCLVTKESHRVRPKSFLCLWYVRCKPCTHLAPTLTLSPNGLKRESTRPMSLTSPSGASKTICEPMVCQD
jgi:hypothetical protein